VLTVANGEVFERDHWVTSAQAQTTASHKNTSTGKTAKTRNHAGQARRLYDFTV
jgi:hypothetical protein